MPTSIESIEAEAMKLSPEQRAALADRLWASVHASDDVAAAWDAEIRRRIAEIEDGQVVCRDWQDVMAELHEPPR